MTDYPRLPRSVRSSAGPVPVRMVRDLHSPGKPQEKLAGYFDPIRREILICTGMARHTQWVTLRHEQIHALLSDAGVRVRGDLEERLCDVIAAGWVSES